MTEVVGEQDCFCHENLLFHAGENVGHQPRPKAHFAVERGWCAALKLGADHSVELPLKNL